MRGESKVSAWHRGRTAVIYVRQSTLAQVRDHAESTARQYALVEEATRLGWPAGRIEVIDTDLGISGRSTEGRDGFKALVARVCLGEVGAIFGLEVSRLARSSADLSRLLELARLTDTLVIDADGIYDLAEFNDRLLLGLKGTMSEAELHLLAGRLQGAKRAAAERGDLRTPLPVGYVHDEEGGVVIDPDEEVSAAIADVFTAFTATGSAYQVVGRVRRAAVPAPGLWRGLGRSAAVRPAHSQPGPRHPRQPGLRRRLRVRPVPLPPHREPGRDRAGGDRGVAPPAVGGLHSATTIPATSAGSSSWPTRRSLPVTAPTRAPDRRGKVRRCVRASCSAARAAGRCPPATPAGSRTTSAPAPGRITWPPRTAGRCAPPRSTTRSPRRCSPRSAPTSSRWLWPPRMR